MSRDKNIPTLEKYWKDRFIAYRDARDLMKESIPESSHKNEVLAIMKIGFEFFRDIEEEGFGFFYSTKDDLYQKTININQNHIQEIIHAPHMYEASLTHYEEILKVTKEVLLTISRMNDIKLILPL